MGLIILLNQFVQNFELIFIYNKSIEYVDSHINIVLVHNIFLLIDRVVIGYRDIR